ncbi:ATP-binding protein [Streptomyces sp. NPDC059740]|uniref:ATP-binding protein n=1 Tax=Streptomyces sp. NPDC059740 TaxID=3346926 RepID=UPI00364F2722
MHEYMSTAKVWGLSCPGFPEEVRRARRWTRDILHGFPQLEDAELIVSELSANAILHTTSGRKTGTFHLSLSVSPELVALSVTDSGGVKTKPKVSLPGRHAVHGRGLAMVTAIADRVVIYDSQAGHTVTAELFTTVCPEGWPC